MKFFTRRRANNTNILKIVAIGLTSIGLSLILITTDPLQILIDSELTLKEGSILFNLWKQPPLDVFISVYMFNVTNVDRFIGGLDKKLKVQEVGPYVYQELLENRNVTFNQNNTITFSPTRKVKFIRQKSIGDPKEDVIVAPNIPYMGVTSAVSSYSVFAAIALEALLATQNPQVMLNISVHDYLWGYEDDLVQLASTLFPNVINFQKFGLLDRMFDEGSNVVTMNLPQKHPAVESDLKNKPRVYSIDNWNGVRGLKIWGYRENSIKTGCNMLQGSYDGTLFPRNISKGETFRVYRKAFCRTFPMTFSHPGFINGIEAYYFKLAENAFDSDYRDAQSACFCKSKVCLPKGLGSISPCYYNIPAAISFPHFLNSDPSLGNAIDGLNASTEKHESEVVLQPQLGIPMKAKLRFQVNILMGDIKLNFDMKPFENTILPILWLEIAVEGLTPGLELLLLVLFKICPYVQMGFVAALMLLGSSLIGFALLLYCWTLPPLKPTTKTKSKITLSTIRVFQPTTDESIKHESELQPIMGNKEVVAISIS